MEIKVGLIGCGGISKRHSEYIAKDTRLKLVAVCDIKADRAEKTSQQSGGEVYTDYHEMLDRSDIQVVHICTPHYLHAPMAIEAMKKGKDVFMEKPMAMTAKQAEEINATAKETGRRVGICFQNRYNNTSQKLKELSAGNSKLGAIKGARGIVTWHRTPEYYTLSGWRGTYETEGGGVMINQSIHTLDLIQWLLGDIVDLKGKIMTSILQDTIEVEDTVMANIRFKSGAIANFYATTTHVVDSPVILDVVFEHGVAKLDGKLTINYEDGTTEIVEDTLATGEKSYWGISHDMIINDYYDKWISKEPFAVPGEQAICAVRLIDMINESSKTETFIQFK